MPAYRSASVCRAEGLFIRLFSETFGAEKVGYLYSQYRFYDIYQNSMVYLGWDVYRWGVRQMQLQPERVTAVIDAKRCGGRVPFLVHTQDLVDLFDWQEESRGMIS